MNFKINFIGLLLCAFLFSCSNDFEKKEEYYPNGSLKSSFGQKNNVLHGEYISYFPDGTVASKMNYENGILEGEKKIYHKNGKLEEVTYWKNGELNGVAKVYTEEGNLFSVTSYRVGEVIEPVQYFYPDGKLREVQILRGNGKVAYFKKFNKDGESEYEALIPNIDTKLDTIALGQDFELTVQMPIPLKDSYSFFVIKGEGYQDTLAPLRVVGDKSFFTITPEKSGSHTIKIGIFHEKELDTIDIHQQSIQKKFYVTE
jgi:hypothetical protein